MTVPNTFIATTEAITQAGATPEFVDVDEHTYNLDAGRLARVPRDGVRRRSGHGEASHRGAPAGR